MRRQIKTHLAGSRVSDVHGEAIVEEEHGEERHKDDHIVLDHLVRRVEEDTKLLEWDDERRAERLELHQQRHREYGEYWEVVVRDIALVPRVSRCTVALLGVVTAE
eukprot:5842012-Prymnesium_polylepis.2